MSALDRLPGKLLALALALCLFLTLAGRVSENRVRQMEARTVDSLPQALLEAGARKSLTAAEKEAQALLEAAGKTVPTADLAPDDPEAPLPGAIRMEHPGGIPWETIGEQTLNRTEQAIVRVLLRSPLAGSDADGAKLEQLALDLKLHYFLDGYYYCKAETDPDRLQRKRAVWKLESALIDSLYRLMTMADELELTKEALAQPMTLLRQLDGESLLRDAQRMEQEFLALPAGDFPEMQALGAAYFADFTETCRLLRDFLATAGESSNDMLGLTGLLGRLEHLYLQALDTLDAGLRFKELSNAVYAEGVDGLELYSRPLVYRLVANSGLEIPSLG